IPWANTNTEGEFVSFKYPATAKVKITYSATVLDAAASNNPTATDDVLKNTAKVEWNDKTDVYEDETETEVYNLGFTKVDGTDTSKTLPGAKFELYSDKACTKPIYVKTNGAEGVYIVDKDATSENGSNSVVTPANGQVVIQGLDVGTYYLKETAAPAGYNMLTEAVEVKIEAANAVEMGNYVVNNGIKNGETIGVLNIANNSGVELPSTGGQGTMLMITIGTMMAIAFAVLLITQKKMSVYHD
ncbi:MAG: SpaH/EbpB family LPXTG-anchored major pilin, partial [Oscillospiraceae bacterium]|nr:SpaH/EbpB family LPXTG-anchored major pilin [Oscillospiraceae bacterium]